LLISDFSYWRASILHFILPSRYAACFFFGRLARFYNSLSYQTFEVLSKA